MGESGEDSNEWFFESYHVMHPPYEGQPPISYHIGMTPQVPIIGSPIFFMTFTEGLHGTSTPTDIRGLGTADPRSSPMGIYDGSSVFMRA
jgi:hypothetical protein